MLASEPDRVNLRPVCATIVIAKGFSDMVGRGFIPGIDVVNLVGLQALRYDFFRKRKWEEHTSGPKGGIIDCVRAEARTYQPVPTRPHLPARGISAAVEGATLDTPP
jgi:hypothetical protein